MTPRLTSKHWILALLLTCGLTGTGPDLLVLLGVAEVVASLSPVALRHTLGLPQGVRGAVRIQPVAVGHRRTGERM